MTEEQRYTKADGQQVFADDREAAKKELWLQLAQARTEVGLPQAEMAEMAERLGVSQSQVARLEKSGYDSYTVSSLRRYVAALGSEFELVAAIRHRGPVSSGRPSA